MKKYFTNPVRIITYGYLIAVALCFILLICPWSIHESADLIDHFFTAISTVSTTGLQSLDFANTYTFFGELICLLFIQLGGIGFMTIGSLIIFKSFKTLPNKSWQLSKIEFSLPKKYPILDFVYAVIIFTLIIESIGAVCLYIGFSNAQVDYPIWFAIFHSISAFCTAGFSLSESSMVEFRDFPWIINTITVLSLIGSIGFIVLLDIFQKLVRRRKHLTLTSRIILWGTFIELSFATIVITLSNLDNVFSFDLIKNAFFQSMSAITTVGFNSVDIGSYSSAALLLMLIIMFIGSSPAGTGGGVKTTTITALIAVFAANLRRRDFVSFMKRKIPKDRIYLADAILVSYISILLFGFWVVLFFERSNFTFVQLLFECISALSTVGLSMGITSELSVVSKLVIGVLMFIGRIGTLAFGLSLINKEESEDKFLPIEDVAM